MQKKAKIGKKSENLGQKRQNWQKFGFFNDFWDTFEISITFRMFLMEQILTLQMKA